MSQSKFNWIYCVVVFVFCTALGFSGAGLIAAALTYGALSAGKGEQ